MRENNKDTVWHVSASNAAAEELRHYAGVYIRRNWPVYGQKRRECTDLLSHLMTSPRPGDSQVGLSHHLWASRAYSWWSTVSIATISCFSAFHFSINAYLNLSIEGKIKWKREGNKYFVQSDNPVADMCHTQKSGSKIHRIRRQKIQKIKMRLCILHRKGDSALTQV